MKLKHFDVNVKMELCDKKHDFLERFNGILVETSLVLLLFILVLDVTVWPYMVRMIP